MRILLLTSVHNGLSQRALVELSARGHHVSVALVPSEAAIAERVPAHDPDLVICPMLTKRIPSHVWRRYRCLIVHPGVIGDRGPSALDWAIQEREPTWGVTILEAVEELDAGDVWASGLFPLRPASKSSIYRREVTDAALRAIHAAVDRVARGTFRPLSVDGARPEVRGRLRPAMRHEDRRIDWSADPTELVLAKLRAADGRPGVSDVIAGREVLLYGGHREDELRGAAGEIICRRDGAICRATIDGAVWITHLRATDHGSLAIKLPATAVLGRAVAGVPRRSLAPHAVASGTWREISYAEVRRVGYLEFACYNGALGTEQAIRLRHAIRYALRRPVRVLVLLGGEDFFCNGIHLGMIEAARSPAAESWRNLLAINAVVREIVTATDKLTIAALRGDAAAGGVMLALAADEAHARSGVILNPHYQGMGLFGSEFWTYLLPRRVGAGRAASLASSCEPVGTAEAVRTGLLDSAPCPGASEFDAAIRERAREVADDPAFSKRLATKARTRERAEAARPLRLYGAAELSRMRACIFAPEAYYHAARRAFLIGGSPPARPEHGPYSVDPSLIYAEHDVAWVGQSA